MNLSPGLALLFLLTPLLGGCLQTVTGSVKGSECKVFEAPRYAVRGAQPYDQDWIDSTVEGGIGACKWARPASRPAELDASRAPPRAAAPVKKRSIVQRVKARIWPRSAVTPVTQVPEMPVTSMTTWAVPATVPAPRSAIDELLHPSVSK